MILSFFSSIEFPSPRKFHSILPFHQNQVIVFGGAFSNQTSNWHALVSRHLWIFNFEQLLWSRLSSVTMLRPTFFHAAAINEVIIYLLHKLLILIKLYI
jgi:hypothetical protein